ncbi:ATP-binding protein [Caulobacter sp. Root1472]|uniref:ATP-binding protein n=1 Tax=Caulobacter sp. Root1472 TaxID=1736470 RepID=UPI000701679F|nr:ATP-binding protein [Caulobacter sp. Root1472]KQZ22089.1 DNA mismatch repair protein [Caulobacter sp. Root1472]
MSEPYKFEISLSVLNHLGRNLYRNFVTVLAEAVSNAWDAEANNVWIDIDAANSKFSIKDDGIGMSPDDFQNKFLKIGYSKRREGGQGTKSGRPYIGAKGIGKLALLSCAQRVSVFSKTEGGAYTGGVIDNAGLDQAIKSDNTADQYPLENLDLSLIEKLTDDHEHGTIIVFQGMKEQLKSSPQHIKKMLALSFKFSVLDEDFNIYINGSAVGEDDLKDLAESTEFLWLVNKYEDKYIQALTKLKREPVMVTTELDVKGFAATVTKPRHLKITGTDERATIDLFVNGRLREKNILRHIPTQKIVESYVYGQLHFDILDREGVDPFTSSREGVVEDDVQFKALMKFLDEDLLPMVIDQWDQFRLERDLEGDDENPRKTKKQRKARDLYNLTAEDFTPDDGDAGKDAVAEWIGDLRGDAEFNLQAYVDCFLSENLARKYITYRGEKLKGPIESEAKKWRSREEVGKAAANISFGLRKSEEDIDYLSMDELAQTIEGGKMNVGPSLWRDAVSYKPVRNAVGHTGLLNQVAKNHLSMTYENIKARIRNLLKAMQ